MCAVLKGTIRTIAKLHKPPNNSLQYLSDRVRMSYNNAYGKWSSHVHCAGNKQGINIVCSANFLIQKSGINDL